MGNLINQFINFNSADPKVLKRSKNIVSITVVLILFICLCLIVLLSDNNKRQIKITSNENNQIDIVSSIDVNAEDIWVNKGEEDMENMRQQIDELLKKINNQESEILQQQDKYNKALNSLVVEMANIQNNYTNNHQNVQNIEYNDYLYNDSNDIQKISIDLEIQQNISEDSSSDLNNYVPIGSYATAKMLSGVDVSTGVNSQNDPNNMMFEIIPPVSVPKYNGKVQEIKKLKGCRVMGSAIGQLWTEKAYIRLLKMSCSFEENKIYEYDVRGYVASFAKEGVGGKIVSREGYFTGMAFLAGAVEGLAKVTETAYSPTIELQSGIATEHIKGNDVIKQAGSSGVSKSAEMLSDYYIKRAEQYQSVVDVPTGIEVEIVFMDSIDLIQTLKIKNNKKYKNVNNYSNMEEEKIFY